MMTNLNQQTTTDTLADGDSRFAQINGVRVHYKSMGAGEPLLVLIHGSFLNTWTWREVQEPLAQHGTVVAFDRPAFGLTERPTPNATGDNPYTAEAQADLAVALLDHFGVEQGVLVGHSTGGTIALLAALRHPGRVRGLVLVGAMVYSGIAVQEFPVWVPPLFRLLNPVGPLLLRCTMGMMLNRNIRSFWHDPARVTPEVLAGYRTLVQVPGWDRGLWELTRASHALGLARRLEVVSAPTLVITGEHDRTVPTTESLRLAEELSNAQLAVIADSGHVPHEEHAAAFLDAVTDFVGEC